MISFAKPSGPSPQPTTMQLPHNPELTTVENVEQLIQPIAAISQIVKANTTNNQPTYLEVSSKCTTDQTIKMESSLCISPAKIRQRINDDYFPDVNQTELSKILLDFIGKCILYFKKLFFLQQIKFSYY